MLDKLTPDDRRFYVIAETPDGERASNYCTRETAEKVASVWQQEFGGEVEIFERTPPIRCGR